MESVNDNEYFIFLNLKTGGKENMIDAVEKMALRGEFCEVFFDYAIPADPPYITDPVTASTTDPITSPDTETVAPTDPVDETTGSLEATDAETIGVTATDKNSAPQTGDAMTFIACIVAADFLVAAAIIIGRKRRRV